MFRLSRGPLLTGLALMASLSCATFASAQSVFVESADPNLPGTGQFGTVNVTTGAFTSLGTTTPVTLTGLAFNSSGTLFAVDSLATTLYTVNQTNGALTAVGGLGPAVVAGSAGVGLAFSPSGTLFLQDQDPNNNSNLFTVDPATGLATLVGPVGVMSSGSIAFVGNTLFESNNASGTGDVINVLNQATGAGTPLPFATAAIDIFGLANVNGTLFGFDANNEIMTINTTLGTSTFVTTSTPPVGQNFFAATFFNPSTPVPEPSALALLVGMGMTGAGFLARRKSVRK